MAFGRYYPAVELILNVQAPPQHVRTQAVHSSLLVESSYHLHAKAADCLPAMGRERRSQILIVTKLSQASTRSNIQPPISKTRLAAFAIQKAYICFIDEDVEVFKALETDLIALAIYPEEAGFLLRKEKECRSLSDINIIQLKSGNCQLRLVRAASSDFLFRIFSSSASSHAISSSGARITAAFTGVSVAPPAVEGD